MKTDSFDFTAAPTRSEVGLLLPAVCSAPINTYDQDHKGWTNIETISQTPIRVDGDDSFALNFTKIDYDYS